MPTLEGLAVLGARFVDPQDTADYGNRTIVGIWSAPDPRNVPTNPPHHGMLLVTDGLPPWLTAPTSATLQSLVDLGISAIAIRGDHTLEDLTNAARSHRLPVLLLEPAVSIAQLTQAVSDLRLREAMALRDHAHQPGHIRELSRGQWEHAIRRLNQVLAPGKAVLLRSGEENPGMPIRADLLANIRAGRQPKAIDNTGPWGIHLHGVGRDRPRAVLAVTFPGHSLADAAARAIELALPCLEIAMEIRKAQQARETNERDRRCLNLHLLRPLISGNTRAARKSAQLLGLSTQLMSASTVRVFLICAPPQQRDETIAACEDILGREHLIACGPTTDNEITIVARDDAGFSVTPALRALVTGRANHHLGISSRSRFEQTPAAYAEARHALDAAVRHKATIEEYTPEPDPSPLLLDARAHAWATNWLTSRLDGKGLDVPPRARRELLKTVVLSLRHGTHEAAKALQVSDNTVRNRIRRVKEALDLDLNTFGHRVVLDLAARIALLPEPEGPAGPTPTLAELLDNPFARRQSERLFASLPDDSRIRRTVPVWLAAGCNPANTASKLNLHRKTVNRHLTAAGKALGTELLTSPRLPPTAGALTLPTGPTESTPIPIVLTRIDLALAALALGQISYEQLGLTSPDYLRTLVGAPLLPPPTGTTTSDHTTAPPTITSSPPTGPTDISHPHAKHDPSKEQARRLMAVLTADTQIGFSTDVLATAQQLANTAVLLGDRAVVYLAEAVFTGEEPPHRADGDLALRSAAVAPITARWPAGFVLPGDGVPLLPDTESVRLHRQGKPDVLTGRAAIHAALGNQPEAIRRLVPDNTTAELSFAVVPLVTQYLILGSVQVWLLESEFTTDDIRVLQALATRAAVSVDNARRHAPRQRRPQAITPQ